MADIIEITAEITQFIEATAEIPTDVTVNYTSAPEYDIETANNTLI